MNAEPSDELPLCSCHVNICLEILSIRYVNAEPSD